LAPASGARASLDREVGRAAIIEAPLRCDQPALHHQRHDVVGNAAEHLPRSGGQTRGLPRTIRCKVADVIGEALAGHRRLEPTE
jgi:hypothetical protein